MRKLILLGAFALGASLGATTSAQAEVRLHGLFTDNMVLQQGTKVAVWGTANGEETVTVQFQKQRLTAKPKDGKWIVYLENLQPGGPFTLTVKGNNQITLKNVLVGEVWVASGQSNMEWPLSRTRNAAQAIKQSANDKIRLFRVPKTPKSTPQKELGRQGTQWQVCGPKTVAGFSAVAYYFARDLEQARKVPVGIIQAAWGGTPAEHWTKAEVLKKLGIRGNSQLYNGMIAPLQPFAIAGVIWYQGESNVGRAKDYHRLFSAMIRSWREDWGQGDFPFLFVQLAPWARYRTPDGWNLLIEAQWMTTKTVPNTAMVVITDYGDPNDIHPRDKEPVGARLALAARAIAYKEDVVYSGPEYTGMTVDGNKVKLSFKHVGGGLVAKGGKLKGFTIAGKDGKFVPAHATIVGNTVVVWADGVGTPTAVRYGWARYPDVNLFNREGLPATPFRTDMPKK